MISVGTFSQYLRDIAELQAKTAPLSEFEQRRLEKMKRDVGEVRKAVEEGTLKLTGVSVDPSKFS